MWKAFHYHGKMRETQQLACCAGGIGLPPATPSLSHAGDRQDAGGWQGLQARAPAWPRPRAPGLSRAGGGLAGLPRAGARPSLQARAPGLSRAGEGLPGPRASWPLLPLPPPRGGWQGCGVARARPCRHRPVPRGGLAGPRAPGRGAVGTPRARAQAPRAKGPRAQGPRPSGPSAPGPRARARRARARACFVFGSRVFDTGATYRAIHSPTFPPVHSTPTPAAGPWAPATWPHPRPAPLKSNKCHWSSSRGRHC